ncbi:aminodeoxychorismate synthase component I [Candidatus Hakubella thermalkaliphila]|uniref:aminodeoxychorismate synthase n=4 Tax=Candidatus Hakubella thermalkaliphila TaxID=2754717 RepID=A0A6V8PAW1_9ACTN|nr:aminodeoxychorismate synthase component I [Candidatus Hakubella thermalkaliphila]GFP27966.1 anthranilate synthase component I [Candidatus Hakubella thermalkaliphila]
MKPFIKKLDLPLEASDVYEHLADQPHSFWLDSGMDAQKLGRFSFMGANPFLVMRSKGERIEILRAGKSERLEGNPFEVLKRLLKQYAHRRPVEGPPFSSGAVGYFSYDLCHFVEELPSQSLDDLNIYDSYFCFYDTTIALDHLQKVIYISSCGLAEDQGFYPWASARKVWEIQDLLQEIHKKKGSRVSSAPVVAEGAPEGAGGILPPHGQYLCRHQYQRRASREGEVKNFRNRERGASEWAGEETSHPADAYSQTLVRTRGRELWKDQDRKKCIIYSNFDKEDYLKAIKKAIDYIFAGDIFQVNLSQRFESEIAISPFQLYKRLRAINPAPFAAFLNFEGVVVASSSPERFLRRSGNVVETRPIKGTRPRGKTPDEDQRLAQELLSSPKDRAENIMIVDLERNDLGRVCQYGSVHVPELLTIEEYPTVFHLVSTIKGTVPPDKDNVDIVKACFPGGSITGAPKVRAMEIIDELEPTRRSVYTGAIGYLDFGGQMDLNIVIRTFIIKENRAYFQAGGGIVADSDPEAEYQETLDKARALMEAVSQG